MLTSTRKSYLIEAPVDLTSESVTYFQNRLEDYLKASPGSIVLDCSGLELVTSSHINVLWQAYQLCANAGVAIRISSPTLGLRRVLKILDLHDFFLDSQGLEQVETTRTQRLRIVTSFETYSDEFDAGAGSIDNALGKFLRHISCLQLPELILFDLRVMFYEIATNIRIHGRLGNQDRIKFSARADNTRIILTFIDSGIPFDPTRQQSNINQRSSARNNQYRGFGIPMIFRMADKVSYVRKNDTFNILTLEKKWIK